MVAGQLEHDSEALLLEEHAQPPLKPAAPDASASFSSGRRVAAIGVALLLGCAGAAAVLRSGGDITGAGGVAEASGAATPQTHAVVELFGTPRQCSGCQCDCAWASQPGACNGHTNDCCSSCCCGSAGVDPGYGVDPGFAVHPSHPVDPGFGVEPGYDHVGGHGDAYHGSYPAYPEYHTHEYHRHAVYYHADHYHVYHHSHHGNFWWMVLFVILAVLTCVAMYFYFRK